MRLRIAAAYSLVIILFIMAFYNGLVVRHYHLNSDKIAPGQAVRIVLIADLHDSIYGAKQSKLIKLIGDQNPDIIALAGDIADDEAPHTGTEDLLRGIKGIAPVYYVSGNHEYWSGDIKHIKETIRKYGVTVLENGYIETVINGAAITIAGVDDPETVKYERIGSDWHREFEQSFSALAEKGPAFKVLLSHRAELVEVYKESNFDLVLSGHAHGGQIRIPLILNGLYSPDQGWFPQYAGGMYNHGPVTQIVSRGVSFNPRLPRIFNPPELVVIDIHSGSALPMPKPL